MLEIVYGWTAVTDDAGDRSWLHLPDESHQNTKDGYRGEVHVSVDVIETRTQTVINGEEVLSLKQTYLKCRECGATSRHT